MGMMTDEAILESASRHFADYGFEGASLRAILRDAGANAAAAHYHFGSKEAVYRAAIDRWLVPLTDERARRFEALRFEQLEPRQRLYALMSAYIAPHLNLCLEPNARNYMLMICRFGSEPRPMIQSIYSEIIEPVRKRYLQALCEIVPVIDLDTARRLFGWMTLMMSNAPFEANYESMAGKPAMPSDPEALTHWVATMACGGIFAIADEIRTEPDTHQGRSP
jgi:TetR/AcrR family transcriptional regulator, regulator of cefoperazone and chloramphenicol sensitivity